MNGDVGKLPSGAVYPTTPEILTTINTNTSNTASNIASSGTDFSSMNGSADAVEPYSVASPPPGGLPASPSPGPIAGIPLDQLKQLLSSQLEYYFSRENLANDAYLLSQMDNDQYVPIWTVANFNQVKKLTKDIKLITDVLRESPNVQVDEEGVKVRPNHKRCIVILREISDNTPLEEVKALFSGENCPKVVSCEFAHNNSWYVTFESDEDAQRAYRFLREEVREFQGKPIMARIKAKPMNRLPMTPVPTMGAGAVANVSVSANSGASAAMKNGYRTPPANMYEQSAYPSQQRFLYTNGASVQQSVNYGNQVQIYAFPPQQPFYPPSMLPPWGPANPTYFDIGSVFSVNGLAPQGSFTKPQSARFSTGMPRRNRKSQPGSLSDNSGGMPRNQPPGLGPSYHRVSSPGASAMAAPPAPKPLGGGTLPPPVKPPAPDATTHHNHSKAGGHHHAGGGQPDGGDQSPLSGSALRSDNSDDNSYRQARDAQGGKEPMPPRHRRRRKEDEVPAPGRPAPLMERKSLAAGDAPQNMAHHGGGGPAARGPQFDLEATAFPPLPGLEGGSGGGGGGSTKTAAPAEPPPVDSSSGSQWESRLSDVVRGTAKAKMSHGTKEKDGVGAGYNSPRSSSPISPTPRKTAPLSVDVKTPSSQPQASQSPLPVPVPPPAVATPTAAATTTTTLPHTAEKEAKDIGNSSNPASHSSVILTPPNSPDKTVPLARNMADKSTKTDDNISNGDGSGNASSSHKGATADAAGAVPKPRPSTASASTSTGKAVPTTTNAATMTSAVVVTDVTWSTTRTVATTTTSASVAAGGAQAADPAASLDCGPARLSYAQVAQHHKEKAERMLREKLSTDASQDREKEAKKEATTSRVANQHNDFKEVAPRGDRDYRESQGRGRGGPRPFDRSEGHGGFRRRDGPPTPRFREYVRPRSPK